ncbi:MAG: 6-phosphofructokinase [Salinivirgaceae bacterium]|nr:6-phosphofructokinase [Salinivirgaceae bacterium]
MAKIINVGVLTSGGDAPGMNAAIRAVTRMAIYHGLKVYGIRHGYHGMIHDQIREIKSHHVSNIIQRGGTILKTARSDEFRTVEGRAKAYENLKRNNIDALVVIGGDGSLTGARLLSEEHDIPCVGVPGTIDNDLYGTDYTIGYDTAINTAMEAVDKIRDTASAHNRLFFVEVMGRDAGFIALRTGIASGAEAILIPERETPSDKLKIFLEEGFKRKKTSGIIIVAEGEKEGGAYEIANKVAEDFKEYDVKVTVLGHIQRGGSPSAYDRVTASQLGAAAIDALLDDQKSVMVGIVNKKIVHVPFNKTIKSRKPINEDLLELAEILSI